MYVCTYVCMLNTKSCPHLLVFACGKEHTVNISVNLSNRGTLKQTHLDKQDTTYFYTQVPFCIHFNPRNGDTHLIRTFLHVPKLSRLEDFHCTFFTFKDLHGTRCTWYVQHTQVSCSTYSGVRLFLLFKPTAPAQLQANHVVRTYLPV